MRSQKMKSFDGELPEGSFAIVKEAADRMGMTARSFVSMAAIKYAMEIKREFGSTTSSGTTTLSPEGFEDFTKLMNGADKYFAKVNEEYRELAKRIDIRQ